MSITNKSVIFIPSKNRANKQTSYEILKELGLEKQTYIVVEPQEQKNYAEKGYQIITLPANDMGISYSRNFILNYCRENNIDYCIQMDDDVKAFYRKDEKTDKMKVDNKAFLEALQIFENPAMNIVYMGLEYQQFAWASKEMFSYGRGIEVIHFMKLSSIPKGLQFDKNTKEDKDFCIQCLLSGIRTTKINYIAMSVPSIGTNAGGLHEFYATKKDNVASIYMLQKWGNRIIKIKEKKEGARIDAMVQWRELPKIRAERIAKLKKGK